MHVYIDTTVDWSNHRLTSCDLVCPPVPVSLTEWEMSGFDNLHTDFYQSSYSVDDQNQAGYGYNNAETPYKQ